MAPLTRGDKLQPNQLIPSPPPTPLFILYGAEIEVEYFHCIRKHELHFQSSKQ